MRLRLAFVLGVLGLAACEVMNVYFVMPLPGSQRIESLDLAYALYQARWTVRAACLALLLVGLSDAWCAGRRWRVGVGASLAAAGAVAYAANFLMAADHMFRKPRALVLQPAAQNKVPQERLVVGIELNGEARAYPLMFIGYHHQVRDSVGGKDVLVTYCTVCRTGRVFSPLVDGKLERFRLVGMDHWNAMFEDETTGSWWRQATGAAVDRPPQGSSARAGSLAPGDARRVARGAPGEPGDAGRPGRGRRGRVRRRTTPSRRGRAARSSRARVPTPGRRSPGWSGSRSAPAARRSTGIG